MTENRQLAYRHEFEASDAKADDAVQTAQSAVTTAEAAEVAADDAIATAQSAVTTADGAAADALLARQDAAAAREGAGAGVIGYATQADLFADLDHPESTIGYVTNDPAAANNGRYRKIGPEGSGSWEQSTRGWDEDDVAGLIGGAGVSPQTLVQWTESEAYEVVTVTRDASGLLTSATVRWPDSSAGVLTVTATDSTWGAVNAFTLSHAESGKVVTQGPVVRDPISGAVTAKPALSVA